MNQRRQFISDQYHFFAEMIIISIIVLLPIHFYYDWLSVWSTFVMAVPLSILFTILEKKEVNYKLYYFILPFLILGFLTLKFPLLLSIPLSFIIIWRYLRIRQLFVRGREANYIIITGLLSLIVYAVTSNIIAIIYLIVQVLVLVLGFMVSHIAVMESRKRNWSTYQVGLYFSLFIVVIALITSWTSNQLFLSKAWDHFVYISLSIIGRLASIFQFLEGFSFGRMGEGDEMEVGFGRYEFDEESGLTLISLVAGSYFGIGLLIAIIGLIVILRIFKRDPSGSERISGKRQDGIEIKELNTYEKIVSKLKFQRIGKKHPVRMMVHKFERNAMKRKKGRKNSETLSEWLHRIGLEVNVDVYQKVRYGKMDVSDKEIENLRLELERVKRDYF